MLLHVPVWMKKRCPWGRSPAGAGGLLAVVLLAGLGLSAGAAPVDRLGLVVESPGPTLADQLDLPRGQGLAVGELSAGSAAAKAGLKAHDILLELNGKPVPADVNEFARLVHDIKAKTPVEVVVLRKGRRETIQGLSLPEAKARPEMPVVVAPPAVQIDVPPALPVVGRPAPLIPMPPRVAFPAVVPLDLQVPAFPAVPFPAPLIPGGPRQVPAVREAPALPAPLNPFLVKQTPAAQEVPALPVPLNPSAVAPAPPAFPNAVPLVPVRPVIPDAGVGHPLPAHGVMTTLFRGDDRFTARRQEGSLVITVTGTVAAGQAKLGEITVQDGSESHKYESLEKVAAPYKDKVKDLVETSAKGSVRVEIKKP